MQNKLKESLSEKEASWALLNASLESALLVDLEGTILTLNERAAKRFGKQPRELIGLGLFDYLPPDLANSRKAHADEVIRKKMAVSFQDEREGMFFENHIYPVFDKKGNVKAFAIYARDITERKRAEEALEENEKRYRSVIEDQTEIICRFKADGTYVFVNEIFCRFFGKSSEELIGHKWYPDAHTEDLELIESKLATMSPKEPAVVIENRVYSGTGEIHWMQFVNRGFYDENGKLDEVQSVGRDITARKQVEKELFESEENFRVLYNNSPDMYVSVSPYDASIMQCNETFLINTGYSREEIIGSPVFKMYHDDCLDEARKAFQQFVVTGKIEDKELIIKRKDGSKIDVSLNVNAVRDETGKILHSISSWRDITENKRAAEQIAKNLKEKEILLKEVNHRVKNNLTVISSLLRLQSHNIKDKQALLALENSRNRIRTMALIHEKLYKSENLAEVDFAIYVKDLCNYLFKSYDLTSEKIKLKLNINDVKLGVNQGIPCALIINELISNTLEHAFPDGRSGEIGIEMKTEDNLSRLIVQDNGIGLPATIDLKDADSLGLQLIQILTEQLHGKLEIDRNNGTMFTITFPL